MPVRPVPASTPHAPVEDYMSPPTDLSSGTVPSPNPVANGTRQLKEPNNDTSPESLLPRASSNNTCNKCLQGGMSAPFKLASEDTYGNTK